MTEATDHEPHTEVDDGLAAAPVVVVGIGFSDGGASALQELFAALAGADDVCFVAIAQQDSSTPSVLPELIARATTLAVEPLVDGTRLRAGRVYLAPVTGSLHFEGVTVRVVLTGDPRQRIDDSLTSLAAAFRARAVGILLSGTGSDGTIGLESIHRHEGMTMAQDDASARFEAMPRNAVTTGVVDHVRAPAELASASSTTSSISRRSRPAPCCSSKCVSRPAR
jgi:two-component system, chemotaxis family, CheB/CheR fusion protein